MVRLRSNTIASAKEALQAAALLLLVAIGSMATWLSAEESSLPRSTKVRVVTYNILADHIGNGWPRRRAAVIGYLDNPAFDIIALQEVTERQIADLAQAMPHLGYVVGERSDGHRGDQGWYEFNPILFNKNRFERVDHSSFWVSETPGIAGSILPGTKDHARVLTWARLRDRDSGRMLIVASVHIHGNLAAGQGRDAHEATLLLEQLRKTHHGEPILLLGDFNFAEGSPGYSILSDDRNGFVDLAPADKRKTSTVIGPNGVTLDGGRSGPRPRTAGSAKRIDYIFACGATLMGPFTTERVRIPDTKYDASDHNPVSAAIILATEGCPEAK